MDFNTRFRIKRRVIKSNRVTNQRDYGDVGLFLKFGVETFKRYNVKEYFTGRPSGEVGEIWTFDLKARKFVKQDIDFIERELNIEL
jgi:hypothetical protein